MDWGIRDVMIIFQYCNAHIYFIDGTFSRISPWSVGLVREFGWGTFIDVSDATTGKSVILKSVHNHY